eukprot:scaffold30956_cov61-Phaeocystis_antarctica.AAC.2
MCTRSSAASSAASLSSASRSAATSSAAARSVAARSAAARSAASRSAAAHAAAARPAASRSAAARSATPAAASSACSLASRAESFSALRSCAASTSDASRENTSACPDCCRNGPAAVVAASFPPCVASVFATRGAAAVPLIWFEDAMAWSFGLVTSGPGSLSRCAACVLRAARLDVVVTPPPACRFACCSAATAAFRLASFSRRGSGSEFVSGTEPRFFCFLPVAFVADLAGPSRSTRARAPKSHADKTRAVAMAAIATEITVVTVHVTVHASGSSSMTLTYGSAHASSKKSRSTASPIIVEISSGLNTAAVTTAIGMASTIYSVALDGQDSNIGHDGSQEEGRDDQSNADHISLGLRRVREDCSRDQPRTQSSASDGDYEGNHDGEIGSILISQAELGLSKVQRRLSGIVVRLNGRARCRQCSDRKHLAIEGG